MIRGPLVHPQLLAALASAGHGSRVLIADGNYPVATRRAPHASVVHLNIRPGLPSVTDVLAPILETVAVEAVHRMMPDDGSAALLPEETLLDALPLTWLGRHEFYAAASSDEVALVVATADLRSYSNVLLTIGVRTA